MISKSGLHVFSICLGFRKRFEHEPVARWELQQTLLSLGLLKQTNWLPVDWNMLNLTRKNDDWSQQNWSQIRFLAINLWIGFGIRGNFNDFYEDAGFLIINLGFCDFLEPQMAQRGPWLFLVVPGWTRVQAGRSCPTLEKHSLWILWKKWILLIFHDLCTYIYIYMH